MCFKNSFDFATRISFSDKFLGLTYIQRSSFAWENLYVYVWILLRVINCEAVMKRTWQLGTKEYYSSLQRDGVFHTLTWPPKICLFILSFQLHNTNQFNVFFGHFYSMILYELNSYHLWENLRAFSGFIDIEWG